MAKKEEQPKGQINILGQLFVRWKDRKGKQKGIVLDKGDIDQIFEEDAKKKKGGNRENSNRTNLE